MKILICELDHNENDALLQMKIFSARVPGCVVQEHIYTGDDRELAEQISDADYLLVSYVPIGEAALAKATKLKMISVTATGYESIDLDAAAKRGIAVCNVTDYCTEEVAIHTISMVLALMRGLKAHDLHINTQKEWNYEYIPDISIPSKMNAVVYGYGKIGQRTAGFLKALGMDVYIVSRHADIKELEEQGFRRIEESLVGSIADIICNHQSAEGLKEHYFDKTFFTSLKRRPIFVNCGRGVSVDEKALADALDAHLVSGAGLDVLESESPDLLHNRLVGRADVILTPHCAFYSTDSTRELQEQACGNIVDHVLNGYIQEKNCVVKGMR